METLHMRRMMLPIAATLVFAVSLCADPPVLLKPGERYFRIDGKQTFLLGRNPTGWKVEQFAPLFQWAADSGETLMRIHLTNGMPPDAPAGEVDEDWAKRWETVFDMAAERGLYVLPVMGVWGKWNDGSRQKRWHSWHKNRYNAALGGPAKRPIELYGDTECRRLWLQWLQTLVKRWQGRSCIVGWEVFSELDLVTGSSESAAVEFVSKASAVVRAADPRSRPVTASLAGIREWPELFASPALDIIQVHPYANHPKFNGNLDEMILRTVRARVARYKKPVLIGECGLDSRPPAGTPTASPHAHVGVRNAIWASAVSGAMAGRMLWWEDGCDRYGKLDLRTRYKDVGAPVARFVAGTDFSGFRLTDTITTDRLLGGAIGNRQEILAWLRDARCVAPDWPVRGVEGQLVALIVPGARPGWSVTFHDTATGDPIGTAPARVEGETVLVTLPAFSGSIAFKACSGMPGRE